MKPEVKNQIMDFLSLPFTRLVEIPITILPILNQWVTRFFNWLSDNEFIDWIIDFKNLTITQ